MKDSGRRQTSRLVPQRPVRRETLFSRHYTTPRPRGRVRQGTRNAYLRSHRRQKPKKNWRPAFFVTLGAFGLASLCLALVVLYHQLLTSTKFCIKDIQSIEIVGLKRLSTELILSQAGLRVGTNLLALSPAKVERALMAHPWIARAELTRKWPQRLKLRIKEREPAALVQMGELFYVDRQGNLFKPLTPGDPHDFPVITGLKPEHFQQAGGAPLEVVAQALKLLEMLKETQPPLNLENISEIHADLERGFTLYANGLSGALDLGLTDHQGKLAKFAQIWPILAQKGYLSQVGRINLDSPHRVLVTLKGMANQ